MEANRGYRAINESEVISEYQPYIPDDQPQAIEELKVEIYQEDEECKMPMNKELEELEQMMLENQYLEGLHKNSQQISDSFIEDMRQIKNLEQIQQAKQSVHELFSNTERIQNEYRYSIIGEEDLVDQDKDLMRSQQQKIVRSTIHKRNKALKFKLGISIDDFQEDDVE
jgi:hypothetical protein